MIATSMNKGIYEGNLTIYCHKELVDTIKTLTKLTVGKKFYKHFDERILFHVVEHGDTVSILGDSFTFFDIGSTKEKQFGFSCQMDNGIKLSFPGDEPYRKELYDFVKGSDWLLHEAFCLYDEKDIFKPYEKHHSTVKDACELAQKLDIPNLVLWHTEDKDMDHRQEKYLAEGIFLHKTGDIGTMLGDAGIVIAPNGKKYIVVILANRPHNAIEGKDFIVHASEIIYKYMVK